MSEYEYIGEFTFHNGEWWQYVAVPGLHKTPLKIYYLVWEQVAGAWKYETENVQLFGH